MDFYFDTTELEAFMRESNWIEGEIGGRLEGKLHKNDLKASYAFLNGDLNADSLKKLHKLLAYDRPILKGDYRDCDVEIGGKLAPRPFLVKELMHNFFLDVDKLSSWEAHIKFEKIHPFEDLNGRTGRLVWAHKFIRERGFLPSSFLQQFYYQSISNYNG